MAMFILSISVPIEVDDQDVAVTLGRKILSEIVDPIIVDAAKVTMIRDGDRSGGNILLPRLDGRVGSHLQGRKATIKECLY